MKRMSEVFELPISDIDGFCSPMEFTEQELHAVHAVNHVDALADALESILADYNRHTAIYPIDMTDDHCAKLHGLMVCANRAVAAYRGDK